MTKVLILTQAEVSKLMPVRDCMPVMAEALAGLARTIGAPPAKQL